MILIADAGNTKTDWRLIHPDGQRKAIRTAGISPYFDSAQKMQQVFTEAAMAVFPHTPEAIYYYGTGCSLPEQKCLVQRSLLASFPGVGSVMVDDDLTGAGVSLFGEDEGVVVITGTGSNAGIIQGGGITHRIRSLGYLLGDEGSGAAIGFRFLKALLSGQLPDETASALFLEMNTTPAELMRSLYAAPKPQTFAAASLRHMHPHKETPPIQVLLRDEFDKLLQVMVLPLMKSTHKMPVGFTGSVSVMFDKELREVCASNGVEVGIIISPEPIEGLCNWWQNRFSAR